MSGEAEIISSREFIRVCGEDKISARIKNALFNTLLNREYLLSQNTRLFKMLETHGIHLAYCDQNRGIGIFKPKDNSCQCGLSAVLNKKAGK